MTGPARNAASIDVASEAVIRLPPEVVAAYASDPSNAPEWYANISEVVWKSTPPLRVSSEVAFVARFLGRALRYTYEVVPMETSYRYESTPEGHTRMTLRNRGTPSFSRLVSPFMRMAMRRANRKDLKALKRRLED
jgi:hypothetical protein